MSRMFELMKERRLFLDGGTGTMLQVMGIQAGEPSEIWNLTHPEKITELHRMYYEAGSDIVCANTFGATSLKYENYEEMIKAAIDCAKKAGEGMEDKFVAMDLGPLGQMLEPLGTMKFERAVEIFADSVRAGVKAGADCFYVETMNDLHETRAAVIAVKENSDLPVMVSNAYDERGRLMTGATPQAVLAMLEGLGVSAIGMNCSFGPDKMLEIADNFLEYSSVPVIFKPNAGLPKVVNGKTVYDIDPEEFASYMVEIAEKGGTILGGCCGTTPDHIRAMIKAVKDIPYKLPEKKNRTLISSYTHHVEIGSDPVLIGERINPTGKKKLKEALRAGDVDYVLGEAIRQEELGAQVLDVNVGLPEIDEPAVMEKMIKEIQAVTDLPLQIDTSDPEAMERGLRYYNGKPLLNSVNGKQEVMDKVFPLVKKYGAAVVALTIGEDGIPETAEERIELALKIVDEAAKYGIEKKDIIVDPLAMTISSGQKSAGVALKVVEEMTRRGIKTTMGVSNISFGLPERDLINQTFFAATLEKGLSSAIMNPASTAMMDTYHAFRALKGIDANCLEYIKYAEDRVARPIESVAPAAPARADAVITASTEAGSGKGDDLRFCIVKGMPEKCGKTAEAMLGKWEESKGDGSEPGPMDIINGYVIPALDEVGKKFEENRIYLPQLLLSAEAASVAFDKIREKIPKTDGESDKTIVLATVKGDVHDIGKNIVKVLLESYSFKVIDLGKDVEPEVVRDTAVKEGVKVVGLSALMTTTVPAMEETIKLIHEADPEIKVMVGGAVLNREYAEKIGADAYSKDGMEAVRVAEKLFGM